ncbi:MAG: hypothetical protein QXN35_01630 [Ignisphaera sp.]
MITTMKKITEEEQDYTRDLIYRLSKIKDHLIQIEPLEIKYEFSKNEEKIVFDPPIQSNMLIYTQSHDKIIIYDYQLLKVKEIRRHNLKPESWKLVLVSKDSNYKIEYSVSFSELLAFLFYTGGYDQIRYKSYEEDNELINVILDVGELVYNRQIPQIDLPQKNNYSQYNLIYIVRCNTNPWKETKYLGIKMEPSLTYSLILLDKDMKTKLETEIVSSKSFAKNSMWTRFDTLNKLHIIKRLIEPINKIKNYITYLEASRIATQIYNSL